VTNGRLWPSPGAREGQLYGSSPAALVYASSAPEGYCGCAAELQTRSPLFATRQVEVPVIDAWRPASRSQPYQTAIALATGLIEPPEPADTILAQCHSSMRRSRRLSGSQEPPRATKRLAASVMEPP